MNIHAPAHGLIVGDTIDIRSVLGMTEVNDRRYTVRSSSANDIDVFDADTGVVVNSTGYGTYVSGGEIRKVTSTVTGLSHLNGFAVTGLADGNVFTATVASGSITLPVPAGQVHLGLGYSCDLETLNPELGLRDGTTQDRKVRIPIVTFRFLNSRGGKAGANADKFNAIVQRTNEALGSPVQLYTGDYRMELPSSYEEGGRVFFRQDDPLPVTILAIMAQIEVGG
jgi:hypothetical protein